MLIDENLLDKVTERAKTSERQCIEGEWDSHPRRSLAYAWSPRERHCDPRGEGWSLCSTWRRESV